MKKIFLGIFIIQSFLYASIYKNIEIKQNMKALYKGIELTEYEENYILDNEAVLERILQVSIYKKSSQLKADSIKDKNVIEFTIYPNGRIHNFKLLSKADNRKVDRVVKKAVEDISNKLPITKESIKMRYIVKYNFENKQNRYSIPKNRTYKKSSSQPRYQGISRGTTRFKHSMKEYIREFETSQDGFVNMSNEYCLKILTVLDENNQRVRTSGYPARGFNSELKKGKYKMVFKTSKTCDINLMYK